VMRRFKVSLLAAAVAVFVASAPVSAITYGEPDAGEHPYVGFMIFYVPAEDPAQSGWFSCSGTLLDADTFLTVGHCTFGIGTNGAIAGTSGGTDVWVTFDETEVLEGFPPRTSLTPEELYPVRAEWLQNNDAYIQGTAIPHPSYDDFSGFPATFDVGIVELSEPVSLATYGTLAPLGTAEQLAGSPPGRNSALVETVGYGIQSVQPHPMNVDSRYKSTSHIVQLKSSIAGGGNLHTLNNPSAVGGRGGSCFGDSGGPVLVNDTNQVLAVVSFGFSPTCHGADYSWRVDTTDSYQFISQYLAG
jgi:hypothetical protein